ncbi:MAG: NAD-dependent deacylase [marine benthic group bacterium]|nr:NAD-dependent deacylase [Gemmatimonadota bacterium]MCL7938683.1 NAD-dependent deacylase [Gemmatimonadota bacterium]MCL7964246.1 NAD-dependent deacylase [Gemmatimonadota bacterium]MCL7967313.1 NAD-dependent deacylase [Gemmatimonadota bacterium]MCL7969617.1 NAD-dependent deacylase [Gemmatimonadota bacterium]
MEPRERARRLVENARAIAVLTGAGVSAESGVPTFRGEGGLWRGRSALDLATPEAFRCDPAEVWEFYHARLMGLSNVSPNEGHRALAALESTRDQFWLLTQNVDGLHRRAGSVNVIELHGSIRTARCSRCSRALPIEEAVRGWEPGAVPACDTCAAPLRPDVVWFGEALPEPALRQAEAAITGCDLMLVAGTSGVVQPAASFAFSARSRGAPVIEVNPEETPISAIADVALRGPSARELPELLGMEEKTWLSRHTADG